MSVMQESPPAGRSRRRFTKEFKADAVALVLDGDRSIASVARDLGIGETNLGNWPDSIGGRSGRSIPGARGCRWPWRARWWRVRRGAASRWPNPRRGD